jgi:hypothetical protein
VEVVTVTETEFDEIEAALIAEINRIWGVSPQNECAA